MEVNIYDNKIDYYFLSIYVISGSLHKISQF